MLREAKRTLTGHVGSRDHDIRYGQHADGVPAVTVDLKGWNYSRTYQDPAGLRGLANDLLKAAAWLAREIAERQEGGGSGRPNWSSNTSATGRGWNELPEH